MNSSGTLDSDVVQKMCISVYAEEFLPELYRFDTNIAQGVRLVNVSAQSGKFLDKNT